MRFQNLHCHTTFSDGLHSLEETVLAAIEADMPSVGISDHSFTACDLSYCMRAENYPRYLEELARVKKTYADRITVYAGLELDSMSRMDTRAFPVSRTGEAGHTTDKSSAVAGNPESQTTTGSFGITGLETDQTGNLPVIRTV